MVKIGILGCGGRMGRANIQAALMDNLVEIVALWEADNSHLLGKDFSDFGIEAPGKVSVFPQDVDKVDVIIDFTSPKASLQMLKQALIHKKGVVIGTTGFSDDEKQQIVSASREIPIGFAPNMSLGVNMLFELLKKAVASLPEEYEVEIIEAHHHHKKDSPSGTAMRLWEIVKDGRNLSDKHLICGREGIIGPRRPNEVGMHSIRCADIVGEHTVIMAVEGERIELGHKASSRLAFAKGAIKAAVFCSSKQSGLYDMRDVLGLA